MITKKLKYGEFWWDEENKLFGAKNYRNETGIVLEKVYLFAMIRFAIRIMSSNWLRNKKSGKRK